LPFKRIEVELHKAWLKRIQNHNGSKQLFATRSVEIRYVDPAFWYSEHEFTREVLGFVKSLGAQ
jgi:hypothetical protein